MEMRAWGAIGITRGFTRSVPGALLELSKGLLGALNGSPGALQERPRSSFLSRVGSRSAKWLTRSSFLSPISHRSAWEAYRVSWVCAVYLRAYYSHVRILVTSWGKSVGAMKFRGALPPLPESRALSLAPKPFPESRAPALASLLAPKPFPESRALSLAFSILQEIPAPPGIEGPWMAPTGPLNPLNPIMPRDECPAGRGCGHVAGPKKLPGAGEGSGDRGLERGIYKWCRPYEALKKRIA